MTSVQSGAWTRTLACGGYDYTLTPRPGTDMVGGVARIYDLAGGVAGDLRGGTSFTVTACVNAY